MKRVLYSILVFLIVSFLAIPSSAQKKDKVLLTIAGDDITVDEFMRVYKKNNNQGKVADKKKSVEEYMDLFINFRLKVKQAEDLKMDTLKKFKKELKKYRKQLAKPYLIDEDAQTHMIREAYKHMQHDLRASHILVRVSPNAPPEDTLKAYQKIRDIRERVTSGESFAKVAVEESEDRSARDRQKRNRTIPGNKGDLGYFTAFDMPYSFEKAAYNLEVGEISKPVRTKYGYHIIKLTDKIPAIGTVKAAHLMLRNSRKDSAEAYQMLDSLRTEIIKENILFTKAVKKYSDDKRSVKNGGKLPEFGSNKMVPEFIKTVSKLEEGEISKPMETRYGYHLIKLIKLDRPGSWKEEKGKLKNKISENDKRAEKLEAISAKKIRKEYDFSMNKDVKDEVIARADSNLPTGDWSANLDNPGNKILFTIGEKQYTQKDFADYLKKKQKMNVQGDPKQYAESLFEDYLDEKTMDYKNSKLEDEYPEFRFLLKEYRNGILLFNLMRNKIWSKAMEDTAGLKKYYKQHKKGEFMWGKRLHATIYKADSKDALLKAKQLIKSGLKPEQIVDSVNAAEEFQISAEQEKFSRGDNKKINEVEWKEGMRDISSEDGKFILINKHGVLDPEPKKLSEVRGLVIADYQNYLEEKWIQKLRDKYEFSVNKKLLKKLD